MWAFLQAKNLGLPGVELDIWLTADHQLAVIHGGNNGELPCRIDQDEDAAPVFVFEQTLD